MPDVISQQVDNGLYVHKHGNAILAIADYSADVPDAFFGADGLPSTLPDGYKVMGYVTTDGFTQSSSISANDTQMLQSLDPVRSDMESLTKTLKATFGEASAWVNSIYSGMQVADWAATNSDVYQIDEGSTSEFPYYRILLLTQDGVGADAWYHVDFAYRAKVTNLGDRTLSRADSESYETTFTCYLDPDVNKSYTKGGSRAIAQGSGS